MIKTQDWKTVRPDYSSYLEDNISISHADHALSSMRLQSKLIQALKDFDSLGKNLPIMVIDIPDDFQYRALLQEYIQKHLVSEPNQAVCTSESLILSDYFGQYSIQDGQIYRSLGWFEKANQGYLIISANMLLANINYWPVIRSMCYGESVHPIFANNQQNISSDLEIIPSYQSQIKLIITGNQQQLAKLEELDEQFLPPHTLFAEFELEYFIQKETFSLYLCFLKNLLSQYGFSEFEDQTALLEYLKFGSRETEDQKFLPLSIAWHKRFLLEASLLCLSTKLTTEIIQQAFEKISHRHSYLPSRALQDIFDKQVLIEVIGKRVGQVNGLTVVDYPGHPESYGEPVRISCISHFGDGEFSDVENKVDLAGHLHTKGMMIIQSFLMSSLHLEEALPFSTSIVFEQSYSEIDGDSASLASLCALVSALSKLPVAQNIAITGAVDQFGNVQAVGGLNQKIESFFKVCQHQGLTGTQGVILPNANLTHLSLLPEITEQIKLGKFHLWGVTCVDDALPILFDKPFRLRKPQANGENLSILDYIEKRIEQVNKLEIGSENWFTRFKNTLKTIRQN